MLTLLFGAAVLLVSAAAVRHATKLLDEATQIHERSAAILRLAEADRDEADRYMQVAIAHHAAMQE